MTRLRPGVVHHRPRRDVALRFRKVVFLFPRRSRPQCPDPSSPVPRRLSVPLLFGGEVRPGVRKVGRSGLGARCCRPGWDGKPHSSFFRPWFSLPPTKEPWDHPHPGGSSVVASNFWSDCHSYYGSSSYFPSVQKCFRGCDCLSFLARIHPSRTTRPYAGRRDSWVSGVIPTVGIPFGLVGEWGLNRLVPSSDPYQRVIPPSGRYQGPSPTRREDH